MALTSLGDLAQSFVARRNLTAVKLQVQQYSKEMANGTAADEGKHLRGSFGPLYAVRNSLAQLAGYRIVANELTMTATMMQTAFSSIEAGATEMAAPLLAAGAARNHPGIDTLAPAGRAQFVSLVATLNTNVSGRAIFGGVSGAATSLPDGNTLLQKIEDFAAGGQTADEVVSLINQWFSSPDGYTAAYVGGAATLPVGIAPGEKIAIGITALSPAFQDTLKGFSMAAILGSSSLQLPPDERAFLAEAAGQNLINSQQSRAGIRAEVASVENRLARALTQNTATVAGLELSEVDLIAVDPEQAALRLTDAEARLELMYAVISRLSRLSLVNYLK